MRWVKTGFPPKKGTVPLLLVKGTVPFFGHQKHQLVTKPRQRL
jgi:hypothetical protein